MSKRTSGHPTPPQDTPSAGAPLQILLYDEPNHDLTPDRSTWPPLGRNIDLSSFWVTKVVSADFISAKTRYGCWPLVFHSKNPLQKSWKNKGQAAKKRNNAGQWVYCVVFERYHMTGYEGKDMPLNPTGGIGNLKHTIMDGEVCTVQSEESTRDPRYQLWKPAQQGKSQMVPSFGGPKPKSVVASASTPTLKRKHEPTVGQDEGEEKMVFVNHPCMELVDDEGTAQPPAAAEKKKKRRAVPSQSIPSQPVPSQPVLTNSAPTQSMPTYTQAAIPTTPYTQAFTPAAPYPQAATSTTPYDWVHVPTNPTPPNRSTMSYHQLLEERISTLEEGSNKQLMEIGVYREKLRVIKGQLDMALQEIVALKNGRTQG